MKLKDVCSVEEKLWQRRQHIKKQRHPFADKGLLSQSYSFSRSDVWMWELDQKEVWVPKNRCFQIVVLEKTLESPLDCKKIKPVNPKGNQPWIFTEGLLLKFQYFGYLMWRANSLEKTLMLGKIESNRRRGWQRMRWLDSTSDPMHMNLNNIWDIVKDRGNWCCAAVPEVGELDMTTTEQQQMCSYSQISTYTQIHTQIYTNIHTTICMYTWIPTHTLMHTYIHKYTHHYMHIHTDTCTYTYVHRHIHEHVLPKMKQLLAASPSVFWSIHLVPPSPAPPGTDPSLTSPRQSKSRYRDVGPQPRQSCCFRCQRVSAAFVFKGKTEKPLGYLLRATLLNTSLKP